MKKKIIKEISEDAKRIILIALSAVLSTTVLTCSGLAISDIGHDNFTLASVYLLVIFIALSLSRLVSFIKNRNVINFVKFIVFFFINIGLGVLVLFAKLNPYLYALTAGLYCISIILSRILKMIQKRQVRSYILNGLLIVFLILAAVAFFQPGNASHPQAIVLLMCLMMAFASLLEVLSNITGSIKLNVLIKIMIKTYALEVIIGLLTCIVAASLVFLLYDDNITNFGDALWYSFAIVTTIGLGDKYPVSLVGRLVSVFLGIYGILVVAIITSIIVNFYNETKGKDDADEIKKIKQEVKTRKEKESNKKQ